MALLSLKVPHDVARLLGQVDVPGEKSPIDEMHITLVYFDGDFPITKAAEVVKVVYGVTRKTRPFTVQTSLATSFPRGDDGIPVIAKIDSPELHAFQSALCKALDAEKLDYSKKWFEYKPHVTLAYFAQPVGEGESMVEPPPDKLFQPLDWCVGEATLWAGNHGDDGLTVIFPFTMSITASTAYELCGQISQKVVARYLLK